MKNKLDFKDLHKNGFPITMDIMKRIENLPENVSAGAVIMILSMHAKLQRMSNMGKSPRLRAKKHIS